MAKASRGRPAWAETGLAALLMYGFFRPWVFSMGTPIAPYQLRDRLEGPQRLLSALSGASRLSMDYDLALGLYAVPAGAALVLLLAAAGSYRPAAGLAAGLAAVAAFFFLQIEVAHFPFHHLAEGAYLSLGCGAGLLLSALLKLSRA